MYLTDQEWETEWEAAKQTLPEIAAYRGKLAEDDGLRLRDLLTLLDEITERVERLYVYAHTRKDQDTRVARYQAMHDKALALVTQLQSVASFVDSEILTLDEQQLHEFRTNYPELERYDHKLANLIRQKPHVLPAEQEQLLAQMGEIARAPSTIFSMINDADMRFPTVHNEQGEEVPLTKGNYISFLESEKREVRREAYEALYQTYARHQHTLASTLQASVKKDVFYARVRNYPSALEAALFSDNVPITVYEQLIAVINERLPLLHRHMRLRQKLLNIEPLRMYDIYTPMVASVRKQFPYEEAKRLVIEAVAPLGEEYQNDLRAGLDSGWVDVYENEGKRGGAYATSAYGVHPLVLLNYQDGIHDVFTLAHEMGHAMHSYYSNNNQPYVYSNYTIFVAEVASTLNEALLMHYLLKAFPDRDMRLYLLNYHLEQFRTVVYRQVMFAEFEKWTHEHIEGGESLTAETLNEYYRALTQRYHGECVETDDLIQYEWARIPHFYSAFYVYKYATGFSAAAALCQQILEEGEPAVARYREFLASGGSDYPVEQLKRAGVDLTTPEPVQSALNMYEKLLDEMEEAVQS